MQRLFVAAILPALRFGMLDFALIIVSGMLMLWLSLSIGVGYALLVTLVVGFLLYFGTRIIVGMRHSQTTVSTENGPCDDREGIDSEAHQDSHTPMKFQEFWKKLSADIRYHKKFTTLYQNVGFEAIMKSKLVVQVTPSTKRNRDIPIYEFQRMWNIMKNDSYTDRYLNTNGRFFFSKNSSYIRAMIDSIVHDGDMQ